MPGKQEIFMIKIMASCAQHSRVVSSQWHPLWNNSCVCQLSVHNPTTNNHYNIWLAPNWCNTTDKHQPLPSVNVISCHLQMQIDPSLSTTPKQQLSNHSLATVTRVVKLSISLHVDAVCSSVLWEERYLAFHENGRWCLFCSLSKMYNTRATNGEWVKHLL